MGKPEPEPGDPARLSRMLAAGGPVVWRQEEVGAVWRHQLSAPLDVDLERCGVPSASGLTFGELLHHPRPSAELLRGVKQFAKACKLVGDGPLPGDVAGMLYFASIAVALLRCGQRISALDDDALRTGLQWARAQAWLDEPTRAIFVEAVGKWAATP